MSAPHPVYRSLIHLYPRRFRGDFGDDLVQHYADLVADRGARVACTRTGLDLIVTVPRYRLESIMSEKRSATTLYLAITLLASGGVFSVLIGLNPGVVLLLAALVLAIAQRSTIARAIRTPDSDRRRRRLGIAAILALVFGASIVGYALALSDDEISTASLLIFNAIGVPAMVGAVMFLIAGLLTPKAPGNPTTPRDA